MNAMMISEYVGYISRCCSRGGSFSAQTARHLDALPAAGGLVAYQDEGVHDIVPSVESRGHVVGEMLDNHDSPGYLVDALARDVARSTYRIAKSHVCGTNLL